MALGDPHHHHSPLPSSSCSSPPSSHPPLYLVTGASGFIGSHLCEYLISEGVRVLAQYRSSTPPRLLSLVSISSAGQLMLSKANLTVAAECLSLVEDVDGVFHLAAASRVTCGVEECTNSNILGTLNLLQAVQSVCEKRKKDEKEKVNISERVGAEGGTGGNSSNSAVIKFVFSSSAAVYGNCEAPHREEEMMLDYLSSPYALSKYVGEEYCKLYSRRFGIPTVRLRYFTVYGEEEETSVVSIFRRLQAEGKPLQLSGNGQQTRDFVHVSDVVKCTALAMKRKEVVDETINIGTGKTWTIRQLAELIVSRKMVKNGNKKKEMVPAVKEEEPEEKLPIHPLYHPMILFSSPRPNDLRRSEADIQRCHQLLGFVPQTQLNERLTNE